MHRTRNAPSLLIMPDFAVFCCSLFLPHPVVCRKGETVLRLVTYVDESIMRLLLEYKADVNARDG
jgi:hypothetical protein